MNKNNKNNMLHVYSKLLFTCFAERMQKECRIKFYQNTIKTMGCVFLQRNNQSILQKECKKDQQKHSDLVSITNQLKLKLDPYLETICPQIAMASATGKLRKLSTVPREL